MSEFDVEPTVREAFAGYRTALPGLRPTLHPAGGVAEVRAIARHRRQVRTAVVATLAAIMVAGPVAGYAAMRDGHRAGPAHPAPSASTSRSESPSASPTASRAAAPDGRITVTELMRSALYVPAWSKPSNCRSGRLDFAAMPTANAGDGQYLWIDKTVYTDLDGDGAQETVAIIWCSPGQALVGQAVAFDRDNTGKIVTLGQVVAPQPAQDHGIRTLFDLRTGDAGTVDVQVADLVPCCGVSRNMAEQQWRTYGWDGSAFQQVDGPTAFTPRVPATKLSVTVSELRFGPLSGGVRHGTVTVTVRNTGTAAAPGVVVGLLAYSPRVQIAGSSVCTPVPAEQNNPTHAEVECHGPGLAVQASGTYTFQVTLPAADDPQVPTAAPSASPAPSDLFAVNVQEEQPGVRRLGDKIWTEVTASRPA